MMLIKKDYLTLFFVQVLVFLFSILLLTFYIGGDQAYYNYLYSALDNIDLIPLIMGDVQHISRIEPLSAFILWIGSNIGLYKIVYISFLNTILVTFLFLYLRSNFVPTHLIFLFLTNFYLIVLISAAERLKISYIFIFLSLSTLSSSRSILYFLLSPFAHLQNVLLMPSVFFTEYLPSSIRSIVSRAKISSKTVYYAILFLIIIGLVFYLFLNPILFKLDSYYVNGRLDLSFYYKSIFLHAILFYLAKDKLTAFLALLPFYPIIFFIGDERVNMIVFSFFCFLLIRERRFKGWIVTLLMVYFSSKSIFFIENIFLYGNGFYKS